MTLNSSSSVNASLLKFRWFAKNITSNSILFQLVFENPLLVSSEIGYPDKLTIEVLPPAFKYFSSLKTGKLLRDVLKLKIRN
jgi:hypothetical protein